jgi:hypothetical protein
VEAQAPKRLAELPESEVFSHSYVVLYFLLLGALCDEAITIGHTDAADKRKTHWSVSPLTVMPLQREPGEQSSEATTPFSLVDEVPVMLLCVMVSPLPTCSIKLSSSLEDDIRCPRVKHMSY